VNHRWWCDRERGIYGWAVIVWLGPGAAVSWLLRDSVAWVNFLSWYAIVVAHGTMWLAKRAEEARKE
jgi:hypothetical protein